MPFWHYPAASSVRFASGAGLVAACALDAQHRDRDPRADVPAGTYTVETMYYSEALDAVTVTVTG